MKNPVYFLLSVIVALAALSYSFIIAGGPETALSAETRYIEETSENQTSDEETPMPGDQTPINEPSDNQPSENEPSENDSSDNQTGEDQPDEDELEEGQPDEDGASGNETAEEEQVPENLPPVLSHIGDKTIDVDETLEFTISASDPDGDELSFSASNLPPGAEFDSSNQTFSWTPSEPGEYADILFEVSDGELTDFEEITITVNAAQMPQYTLTVNINGQGTVTITPYCASYASGTQIHLTATPSAGWCFSGWSGSLTESANPVTVTIDANTNITATFVRRAVCPPAHPQTPGQNAPPPPDDEDISVMVTNELKVIVNLDVLSIIQEGKIAKDIEVISIDNNVWLDIRKSTVCLDPGGTPLTLISIQKLTEIPDGISGEGIIGAVYSLAPDGATFSPAATIFFRYDPSALPEGMAEENLAIVWWDNGIGKWVKLDTVVDTQIKIVSAVITHCSLFSLALEASESPEVTQAEEAITPAPAPAETEAQVETEAPVQSATPEATSAPETEEVEEDGGSNWGYIVLIIAGVLLVGTIVAMGISYWSKKDVV